MGKPGIKKPKQTKRSSIPAMLDTFLVRINTQKHKRFYLLLYILYYILIIHGVHIIFFLSLCFVTWGHKSTQRQEKFTPPVLEAMLDTLGVWKASKLYKALFNYILFLILRDQTDLVYPLVCFDFREIKRTHKRIHPQTCFGGNA